MMTKSSLFWLWLSLAGLTGNLSVSSVSAQTANSVQIPNSDLTQRVTPSLPPPQDVIPISPQPPLVPPPSPPPQPNPPDQLLQPGKPANPTPETVPGDIPGAITVDRFEVVGSTVFSQKDFEPITAPYTKRPISLAELFEVRSKITQFYLDRGYITSGAYIPPQELDGGVIKIQISEGGLEDIKVMGTQHLNPNYVRSRLGLATRPPLNQKRILDALQLLKLNDRLIQNISAELSAGAKPGESLLTVQVTEAPRWNAQISLDNGRTPSVGTFRRQLQLTNFDLLGLGDTFSIAYTNTDGSNAIDTSYTIPFNPHNGTISLSGSFSFNHVVERPFDFLDINSDSNDVELTVRQPLWQTPSREFAVGFTISHRESGATLLDGDIPFPSPGSDDEGNTRITALRMFQEYTVRNSQEVLALRSQFSFGLNAFNSTINSRPPDSNFFAWRGQAQYVRLLAGTEHPDTLLLLRGDVQLSDRPIVPLEQFGLGGIDSVRGYRQDQLLADSGIFLSAEVRVPIVPVFRAFNLDGHLQLAAFADFGHVWNRGAEIFDPSSGTLSSVGLGLRFRLGDRLTARFDWGAPFVNVSGDKRTLQEQGFYFSLVYNHPF